MRRRGPRGLERIRFRQRAAQIQRAERRDGADHERYSPAPVFELLFGQQHELQDSSTPSASSWPRIKVT